MNMTDSDTVEMSTTRQTCGFMLKERKGKKQRAESKVELGTSLLGNYQAK